jgi:hypothetical protein
MGSRRRYGKGTAIESLTGKVSIASEVLDFAIAYFLISRTELGSLMSMRF